MRLHPTGRFDNSARSYVHIVAEPLAAAMGAEIRGVQVSRLTDEAFAEIADALYRHKMIFFRDQDMGLADQERFTLRFGPFGRDAYTQGIEGHPDVQRVVKEADARTPLIFGSGWHTDSPFLARPPAISLLYGFEIPPFGGDTIWSDTELAFRCLSPTMQEILRPLKVRMSAGEVLRTMNEIAAATGQPGRLGSTAISADAGPMVEGAAHPLVRRHPVTGAEALYVDETYTRGIEGLTDREAAPLIAFLQSHVTQPAFTCRLRWAPRTFALWDNRLCIHQAFNDHDGYRREMHRTIVEGEEPSR
ncbi:TauD/TfdA dioxygenase family protein [Phenylobacterium montanum]|uniref:TauD/TfdA family dioxygenase n=1 Tax=Phenylobacterium montanum TaxID=2823693 RepID=A0A975G2L1_9CAUL|nr:TauD/TfdA family dioxygenase [Caulobacter sp. S6]QUD89393.1 TauD/TfdA family dioxygenase [Caulobacter sp. S6]